MAFGDFEKAHKAYPNDLLLLLVDSEDPVTDIKKPWEHLKHRKEDNWTRPERALDEHVFLMTTCMETWIVADGVTLKSLYRSDCFQENALPDPSELELRDRHKVQDAIEKATRKCKNYYKKGRRSYKVFGLLNVNALEESLPSFGRMAAILRRLLPLPPT